MRPDPTQVALRLEQLRQLCRLAKSLAAARPLGPHAVRPVPEVDAQPAPSLVRR